MEDRIRNCLARVKLFNNLTLVIALVALILTIGLPRVGIIGTKYTLIVAAAYLSLIVAIVKTANPSELKHESLILYPGFRPVKCLLMLAIECVLAFGLPLVGVAAGTKIWFVAVIPVMLLAIYLGIKSLNKYIRDTDQQIIQNVWGPNIKHRSNLAKQ